MTKTACATSRVWRGWPSWSKAPARSAHGACPPASPQKINPEQSTLSGFSVGCRLNLWALVIRVASGCRGMGMPPGLGLCYVSKYGLFPCRSVQNGSLEPRHGCPARTSRSGRRCVAGRGLSPVRNPSRPDPASLLWRGFFFALLRRADRYHRCGNSERLRRLQHHWRSRSSTRDPLIRDSSGGRRKFQIADVVSEP